MRGQLAVHAEINGRPVWLTVDALPCSVDDLAACLGDAYMYWETAELLAFSREGRLLSPNEQAMWVDAEPIRFFRRPKKAKTMCGRCGLTLHRWHFGWKHASGGRLKRKCCDSPVAVSLESGE